MAREQDWREFENGVRLHDNGQGQVRLFAPFSSFQGSDSNPRSPCSCLLMYQSHHRGIEIFLCFFLLKSRQNVIYEQHQVVAASTGGIL